MVSRTPDFWEQWDTMFVVAEPAIPGKGEDNFCGLTGNNSAMVSVFDGCGGLGSRTYPGLSNYTGAYISARVLSGAIHDWFVCHSGDRWSNADELVGQIRSYFDRGLATAVRYSAGGLRLRGTMARDFPSTAAIAFVRNRPGGLVLHVIWAGDSRVYLMDADGIAQLTVDDVDDSDALSNLANDGALNNVVSSDGMYKLHHTGIRLKKPAMVFAASDGCFGYLPTPMEFEYAILHSLEASATPEEFRQQLKQFMAAAAGDDFSLALMSFGFGSFAGMRTAMAERYQFVWQRYISQLDQEIANRDSCQVAAMWEEYRKTYERYLYKTGGAGK